MRSDRACRQLRSVPAVPDLFGALQQRSGTCRVAWLARQSLRNDYIGNGGAALGSAEARGFDRERVALPRFPNTRAEKHQRSRLRYRRGGKNVFQWKVGPGKFDRTLQSRDPELGRQSKECGSRRATSNQRRREDRMSSEPAFDDAKAVKKPLNVNGTVTVWAPSPVSVTVGVTNVPPLGTDPEEQLGIMHAVDSGLAAMHIGRMPQTTEADRSALQKRTLIDRGGEMFGCGPNQEPITDEREARTVDAD